MEFWSKISLEETKHNTQLLLFFAFIWKISCLSSLIVTTPSAVLPGETKEVEQIKGSLLKALTYISKKIQIMM